MKYGSSVANVSNDHPARSKCKLVLNERYSYFEYTTEMLFPGCIDGHGEVQEVSIESELW